jgi:hypothetical protein
MLSEPWLIIALIGFVSQLTAACVAAWFSWIAARKLATTVVDLARNTAITKSTHDTVEATHHAVNELERPFLTTRDWAPPGGD